MSFEGSSSEPHAQRPGPAPADVALSAASFLSGCSALAFETLWFRQAGLVLGNAVWSSSIVLGAFMAGLAVGSAAASRLPAPLRRPLLVYAALELVVGTTGAAIVIGLPGLGPLLAPAFQASWSSPALLNWLRGAIAFALLAVPATAMGLTLPVLVQALSGRGRGFGAVLGQLYGWNTAGAVAGALLTEMLWLDLVGVRGAGTVAGSLNGTAAALALALHLRTGSPVAADPEAAAAPPPVPLPRPPLGSLAAAFLAGGLLLALEVVWFRILLLGSAGTSLTFAVMLAVVLGGIAMGGFLASRLSRVGPDVGRLAPALGFLTGAASASAYVLFGALFVPHEYAVSALGVARLAAPLMLPACVCSGMLFTMLGQSVRGATRSDAHATGLLTLSNTLGAMLGAVLGGYVILPGLGAERALYALTLGYAAVGVLALSSAWRLARGRSVLVTSLAAAATFAVALAAFPFGTVSRLILPGAIARWVDIRQPGNEVVAVREGITETAVLVRQSAWGRAIGYRLLTNGIAMSGLHGRASRYMKAFVYLPMALRPDARRALLISYGVGVTAKALTDSSGLDVIDVVDTSSNVIEATRLVYPRPHEHPLDDPRVRLHVEDGRFFLLASRESWDVITAEPPPPNMAGTASLYSREHFALLRSRLSPGGVASYWLPVALLREDESRAIATAFCSAFPDCTLWSGSGAEWILAGTRDALPVDESGFGRQWRDPRARAELSAWGFEQPEDLGVTFLADAFDLATWSAGVPAVDDDHPHRISSRVGGVSLAPYRRLASWREARTRFERSGFVRRIWPPALRASTLESFEDLGPLLEVGWRLLSPPGLAELRRVLERTSRRTGVLWLMGSDAPTERAAREAREQGLADPELDRVLAISAMADRDYRTAERLFARAQPHLAAPGQVVAWRTLALCLLGERQSAAAIARFADETGVRIADAEGWWALRSSCGITREPESGALR